MRSIAKILLMILCVVSPHVYGQYYVSETGNNNNPGTIIKPFRTIQKAAMVMKAGDSCFIRQGTYREEIKVQNNGKCNFPIVFMNYNDEKVIIKGTEIVNTWVKYKLNIYKTFFPDSVFQLMVNRKIATEARYPNKTDEDMLSCFDWADVISDTDGKVIFSSMNVKPNFWNGATCLVLTGKKWVSNMGIIAESDSNYVICSNRSFHWNNLHGSNYSGSGKGYIIKHLNAVDQENEWHWQNDTLYFFTTKNIDSLTIEARVRNLAFNCDGKSNIVINGLNLINASISFRQTSNCVIENSKIIYPTPFYQFSNSFERKMLKYSDTILFSINHWDGRGIAVSGNNNIIRNCYIANSWGDGISLGGSNNAVINCLVENCNWIGMEAAPISVIGKNHFICFNTIRNAGRNAITHRDCSSLTISNNNIYYFGCLNSDLGGTYTYNTDGKGTEISYNNIHDNMTGEQGIGIYLDNYTSGFNIHHNLIYNCEIAIKTNKPGQNHSIYNNTVWNCDYTQSTTGGVNYPELSNVLVFNNLSNKEWTVGTDMQNNLSTNSPKFNNINEFDFTLKESSPAIDYGKELSGYSIPFTGKSPDAGAFEFQAKRWTAGTSLVNSDVFDLFSMIPDPQKLIIDRLLTATFYPEKQIIKLDYFKKMTCPVTILFINHLGETVIKKEIKQADNLLDFINIHNLNSGIYLIRIQTKDLQKDFLFAKN